MDVTNSTQLLRTCCWSAAGLAKLIYVGLG